MNSLPDEFNTQRTYIMFKFIDADVSFDAPVIPPASLRYVKLVKSQDPFIDDEALEDWMDMEARRLWQARYGELPLIESLYGIWADTLAAEAIPYDGPTSLTPCEQDIIYRGDFGDLTIALLYVMIEGFGWRPGAWYVNGGVWPQPDALMTFYRHWPENDDPEGALLIALSVFAGGADAERCVAWEKIAAIARGIDQEARACAQATS